MREWGLARQNAVKKCGLQSAFVAGCGLLLLWGQAFSVASQVSSSPVPSSQQQAAVPAAVVTRFERNLSKIKVLSAHFKQVRRDATGEAVQEGRLFLSKPGRLRWEVSGQRGQVIVADGQSVWIYDKAMQQVWRKNWKGNLGKGNPVTLLSGDRAAVYRLFQLQGMHVQPRQGMTPPIAWFVLLPRHGQSSGLTQVMLGFVRGQLYGIKMADQLGGVSTLYLRRVRYGPHLKPDLFHFVLPPGVDYIDETSNQ